MNLNREKLTKEEMTRYSRHLLIPEVGQQGQERLKGASVLIIGAGGLGSPAAYYLAAAGIGRIGIVDFDVVDVTNLQRQILHSTSDVGRPKTQSAMERLRGLNPSIEICAHELLLNSENAFEIIRDYDVIVDGTDNFPTRYLVNDACVLLNKPCVYGSIFLFEGQASVFWAEKGPCYRCLYPEPPPPGEVPSCSEAGVLGVLPGIIGAVQASEALKIILGIGKPLIGELLFLDALEMQFRNYKVVKNPECPVCGESPTIRELIDYDEFCGVSTGEDPAVTTTEITVQELHRLRLEGDGFLLLDVREQGEMQISRLDPCVHMPMGQVPARLSELDRDAELIVMCRSGRRSADITEFLISKGFRSVRNLAGGINAYAREIDGSIPVY